MKLRSMIACLLALVIVGALASCGSAGDGTETTDAATQAAADTALPGTEAQVDDWGRPIVEDGIPDNLKFTDTTLNILSRSDANDRWRIDYYADEQNGVVVNDAVYRRNSEIEQRLGITIDITERPGSYTEFDSYASIITAAYQSGSHQYDLVGTYSLYGAEYATQGYFKNVLNMSEYLDLDQIWWNQMLREDLTIANRMYFTVGDMNITTLMRMLSIFYNKTLMGSSHAGLDLYRVVIDREWTIDYFTELIASSFEDLNGDQKADKNDKYGLVTVSPSEAFDSFAAALDVHVVDRAADGTWKVTENSEYLVNALDKTAKLYFNNHDSSYFLSVADTTAAFAADKADFMIITLDKASESPLTEMKSEYGVLPLPMYDADQAAYYTIPQDAFNLTSVMGDVKDPDMVAAALTLMSAGSYRDVIPLYFEEVLKFRYMSDSESGMMLDYLRDGLRYDFATINTRSLSNAGHWFRGRLETDQGNAGSSGMAQFRAASRSYALALQTFIETYEGLPE